MTTIAAGQSGSYTFTELSNVTVSLDSGERALVVVLSGAGDQLFSDRVSSTKTIGPFPTGAVLTVTADGAAVDYAVSTAKADGNFASYTGKEAVSYATDPITGLDVLDAGSQGVVLAATGPDPTYKTFVVIGDSIAEGSIGRSFLPDADLGWRNTNIAPANTIIKGALCSYNCGSTADVVIAFDGTKYATVAIDGDTVGPAVDIGLGGFYQLKSGSNGKSLFITSRTRSNTGAIASTQTGVSTGSITVARHATSELWAGGFARAKMGNHRILNYGLGGDNTTDVLSRLFQVIDLNPDAVCLGSIGYNNADKTIIASDMLLMIDRLNAAGIFVFVCLTMPAPYLTADALLWSSALSTLRYSLRAAKYQGRVAVVEPGSAAIDPTVANGASMVQTKYYNNTDSIHPSMPFNWGPAAKVIAAALVAKYPLAPMARSVGAADAYGATNLTGNLFGVRAGMAGTAGGKGITPVPTGTVPTSWTDSANSANAYTSVVFTAPGDGSPVARDDGGPGNWFRIQASGAHASGSSRYMTVAAETSVTPGRRYRLGLTVWIRSALNLTALDIYMTGVGNAASLLTLGLAPKTGTTFADDAPKYLVSQPFMVPPGSPTGTLYISYGNASGGGLTMDIADLFLEPVLD